ncbi:MAG: nitroreductase family protein [Candidatus Merdivicinus sp.]
MDLMQLLQTRRTYRRFEQRPIPQQTLDEILESTRLASSGGNRQPLRYIVIRDPQKVAEVFSFTKWAAYLPPEDGMPKEGERPVLFIAVLIDENIAKAPGAALDAGLAISNMTLTAWNHGVGSCIIGAFNRPKVSEYLGLSEQYYLQNLVAFGYPTHTSVCEEFSGSVEYYLDSDRNYHVPKRSLTDTVSEF